MLFLSFFCRMSPVLCPPPVTHRCNGLLITLAFSNSRVLVRSVTVDQRRQIQINYALYIYASSLMDCKITTLGKLPF